jgi:hypothetical protein
MSLELTARRGPPQLDHSHAAKPSATIARNSRIHSTGADVLCGVLAAGAGRYDGGAVAAREGMLVEWGLGATPFDMHGYDAL